MEDKIEQVVHFASAVPCCGDSSCLFYHTWFFSLLSSGISVRESVANLYASMSLEGYFVVALHVTQPTGSHERGREERRWGRTFNRWREVFFRPVQEKQFVVPSPSRKHQPLFPLNQQCENGVSVWVKMREREKGDGTMVGRHGSTAWCHLLPLPWFCPEDTPNLLLSPSILTSFSASVPWHRSPLVPKTTLH